MNEPLEPIPEGTRPTVPMVVFLVAAACGMIALLLGVRSAVADMHQDTQRENDRIESDLAACESGNVNRRNQVELAKAQMGYVDDVMSGVEDFARLSEAERAILAQHLLPAHIKITDAIEAITFDDCAAVVPGAKP